MSKKVKISVTLKEELVDELVDMTGAESVEEAVKFFKMLLKTMLRKEGLDDEEASEIMSFDMKVIEDDDTQG